MGLFWMHIAFFRAAYRTALRIKWRIKSFDQLMPPLLGIDSRNEPFGHDNDLITTQLREAIRPADMLTQSFGDGSQQQVTDRMAITVVHRLETVEVNH